MVRVIVGSLNPSKIESATLGFSRFFSDVVIVGVETASGVADQPFGFQEMVEGAKNRAREAFTSGMKSGVFDFGVGIEAGIYFLDGQPHQPLSGAVAAIFDGKTFGFGVGPGFEIPASVAEASTKQELGLVIDKLMNTTGSKQKTGAIGLLTSHKVQRSEINSYAVMMALVPFMNKKLFESEGL